MYQLPIKANIWQPRGVSPPGRILRALVLAGLWLYFPLEAFDADAIVGLDDAVLQSSNPISSCTSSGATTWHISGGPPIWRPLPPARVVAATPLLLDAHGPGHREIRRFRASRLCARARIAEPSLALSGGQIGNPYLDTSSRPFHGSSSRGEGGRVFGEPDVPETCPT